MLHMYFLYGAININKCDNTIYCGYNTRSSISIFII